MKQFFEKMFSAFRKSGAGRAIERFGIAVGQKTVAIGRKMGRFVIDHKKEIGLLVGTAAIGTGYEIIARKHAAVYGHDANIQDVAAGQSVIQRQARSLLHSNLDLIASPDSNRKYSIKRMADTVDAFIDYLSTLPDERLSNYGLQLLHDKMAFNCLGVSLELGSCDDQALNTTLNRIDNTKNNSDVIEAALRTINHYEKNNISIVPIV